MAEEQKVTEEQATEALRAIMGTASEDEGEVNPPVQVETEVEEPEPPAAEAPKEEPPAEGTEAPATTAAADTDDVTSLKKRLEEIEKRDKDREKFFEARQAAFQARQAQNEQILRDRYVRKSAAADQALRVLRASKQGVPEPEIDRVIQQIESTMNPASANFQQQQVTPEVEDQAITLNSFLNEKGMTSEDADKFGQWIRTDAPTVLSPAEQAIASQSLDGFLRLAHRVWQEGSKEKEVQQRRAEAVNAVKTVQRTQKEAARAATASPSQLRTQPSGAATKELDLMKLSKEDRHSAVSQLLKMSVEQYK